MGVQYGLLETIETVQYRVFNMYPELHGFLYFFDVLFVLYFLFLILKLRLTRLNGNDVLFVLYFLFLICVGSY